jgi:hypothetical protein
VSAARCSTRTGGAADESRDDRVVRPRPPSPRRTPTEKKDQSDNCKELSLFHSRSPSNGLQIGGTLQIENLVVKGKIRRKRLFMELSPFAYSVKFLHEV